MRAMGVVVGRGWFVLALVVNLGAACASSNLAVKTNGPKSRAATKPNFQWEKVVSASMGYAVELPAAAIEETSSQGPNLSATAVSQFIVEVDGHEFGLVATRYPEGRLENAFPQQVISASRDVLLGNVEAEVKSEERNHLKLPDGTEVAGRLLIAETAALLYYAQWYIARDTLFQLTYLSPKEVADRAAFDRFVGSLVFFPDSESD